MRGGQTGRRTELLSSTPTIAHCIPNASSTHRKVHSLHDLVAVPSCPLSLSGRIGVFCHCLIQEIVVVVELISRTLLVRTCLRALDAHYRMALAKPSLKARLFLATVVEELALLHARSASCPGCGSCGVERNLQYTSPVADCSHSTQHQGSVRVVFRPWNVWIHDGFQCGRVRVVVEVLISVTVIASTGNTTVLV
jgi:hypothetical protein